MRDMYGRKIIVNDCVLHTFPWGKEFILIRGSVIEVWDTGITLAYEDDRIVIENEDTIEVVE